MKNMTKLIVCVMISFLFSACIPTSKHPLSSHLTAYHDKRLTGTWIGRSVVGTSSDDESFWVHFVEAEGSLTDIVLISFEKKGVDVMFFKMFPTTMGNSCYMNIKTDDTNSKMIPDSSKGIGAEDFYIAKYDISGDTLKIWFINNKIKDAIISTELKGAVEKDMWSDTITLTDTAQKISEYIRKPEHQDCFDLTYVCRKVNAQLVPTE
ncbi:MAG: hypothetical protein WC799_23970 [Desulfobacteraceae bacterium]|jgi:hypothetical protein